MISYYLKGWEPNLVLRYKMNNVVNCELTTYTGSSIAKSGFKEEENICDNLNNNDHGLRDEIESKLGIQYNGQASVLSGNSKTDIQYGKNFQAKKYTGRGFGQLDRHYVDQIMESIPGLVSIKSILNGLCELPLCDDGRKCDRTQKVKKLCNSVYSDDELALFIKTLNENKKAMLNYVFLGTENETTPEFIIGVQYIQNKRNNITIYNISEVIDILMGEDFKIRKSKTVFDLGKAFSFQRKGGDNGNKSANHIQCKFSFGKFRDLYDSKIVNKVIINL